MIDIATETLISLSAATKLIPPGRGGAPCSFSCILRWGLKGARAADGSLVKLEMLRVGGRFCTSAPALQRFFERLTPGLNAESAPKSRTPRQRERAADREALELEALGI